jgi:hypothetical protein
MPTLADLFKTCYLTGGSGVEFSAIRLHYGGVDEICRAFGAAALTVGSDIFFRREAFAPYPPEGHSSASYAAGHLINKILVMQWYIEWPAAFTGTASRRWRGASRTAR